MNGRILTVVVTALVAVGVGVGIGAAVWAGDGHGDEATSAHDAQTSVMTMADGGMDERDFLEQMVPHHESALAMAQFAVEQAQRPEVRQLAEGIIAAQNDEIAEMRDLYRSWYGDDLVPSTEGLHHDVDMGELEVANGTDFDRTFLRMMIPHHASAIVMGEAVMMGSPHQEVAGLADEITAAQAKEVGQMQRWREAWFPPFG
jgi:uncharacterized protein (DUF305 family)